MEACATAHYWARELTKLGHEVRLMPAKDVKAYRQANVAARLAADSLTQRPRIDHAVPARQHYGRRQPRDRIAADADPGNPALAGL